jgi:hypothetical protein
MRYSGAEGWRGSVTVDGRALFDVIECDTAEGWADFVVKKDGKLVLNGDEIMVERVFGAVVFTPEGAAA